MPEPKDLRDILKKFSLKVSEQRLVLLQQIVSTKAVFSADSLYHDSQGKIDLATIYRFLKVLQEKSIICQVQSIEDNKFYEYCLSSKSIHPHFQCTKCHKLICLEKLTPQHEDLLRKYSQQNEIKQISLTFTGLCAKCK